MASQSTGIPYISVHLSPFGNSGGKRFAEATRELINPVRERLGFPPLGDPLGADAISQRLALFPVSRHVFRRPVRWPQQNVVSGFLFLDEPHVVDAELEAFVAEGD